MKQGIRKWPGRHEGPVLLKNRYKRIRGREVCIYQVEAADGPNRHDRRNAGRIARYSERNGWATKPRKNQIIREIELGITRKALRAVEGK